VFLFKKKPKGSLGIDIGASAIKLVELEKEERYKLKNYAIFSLRKYLGQTDSQAGLKSLKIANEEIAQMIKKSLSEAKIDAKEAYLSIPVYFSFTTLIDFPMMPEEEIAGAVSNEARKYVPVPISEVVLDWSIVGRTENLSPAKKKTQQVLLIAVPKKVINNYSQIVQLAGLKLKAIEEETFSLSRALIGNDKSAILLIDAGARSVNVSVVDNGYIRLTHNLEMGGVKITKAIAQQMNIDLEKAEELKIGLSKKKGEKDNRLREIVQVNLHSSVAEIKRIVDSYQIKYSKKIEKCILVGGAVFLNGFRDNLMRKLSLDISVGNPFARVVYPPLLKPVLDQLGPSLAVAVGLAMRGQT
jgi:type IV pilus assembly protein PilM